MSGKDITDDEIQDLIDELDNVDKEVKDQPNNEEAVIGYLSELAQYFTDAEQVNTLKKEMGEFTLDLQMLLLSWDVITNTLLKMTEPETIKNRVDELKTVWEEEIMVRYCVG